MLYILPFFIDYTNLATTQNTPLMIMLMQYPSQSTAFYHFFPVLSEGFRGSSHSLSTAEAVAITAVVCLVCSLIAGLLLGVLCHVHCQRKEKRGQTEITPVYDYIQKPAFELHSNEAYGHIPH